MKALCRSLGIIVVFVAVTTSRAQDLIPRAYLITPTSSNAVTMSYVFNDGQITFDPSVLVENASGRLQTPVLSYYHSFGLLGRSSNLVVSLPYVTGTFQGTIAGENRQIHRSGLLDGRVRLAVNLKGGPAMPLSDYLRWREKLLIGVSLSAVIPIGQYDPARVINPGTNRWAFKPEVGITRRWGKWVAEAYGGAWLFGPNSKFYPGGSRRTQNATAATEAHLGYYVRRGLWASVDANFWAGGRSSINGIPKDDVHRDSRVGGTVSMPITRHNSFKLSYSRGAIIRVGGNFNSISAAWQYSWIGKAQ